MPNAECRRAAPFRHSSVVIRHSSFVIRHSSSPSTRETTSLPSSLDLVSFARSHFLAPGLLLAFTARAAALHLELDYAYDAAHGNYFATHEPARLALEKAAADVGDLLATPLGAITANTFTGTQNTAFTTFNWSLSVINPSTGMLDPSPPSPFTRPADTIVVHVGFQAFPDDRLGGAKIDQATKTINSSGSTTDRVTATGIAEGASNAMLSRGAAPVMGAFIGQIGTVPYSLRYGPLGGSLWFDSDIDNDNAPDLGRLDEYWHFDTTTPVPAGKRDFYSVALRELVHTLGFGEGTAWAAQAQGTNWKGERAAAFYGNDGTGLITSDGQIAQGLGGSSLFDGTWQPAAMSPGLAAGERRYLTTLDVAFLQDLGYQMVPEPGSLWLAVLGVALLGTARRVRPRRGAPVGRASARLDYLRKMRAAKGAAIRVGRRRPPRRARRPPYPRPPDHPARRARFRLVRTMFLH
jgi:hypothetical protein